MLRFSLPVTRRPCFHLLLPHNSRSPSLVHETSPGGGLRYVGVEGVSRLVTSITPQPTLVDKNCLGRNNDRFVSPSCAREVMAKLTRRRAIYAHASAGDTREPANTPHRSSAGRLACAKTQRRNLVSLSWIRFSPTLYNMAVSVCSHTFFPQRSRVATTPIILVFGRFLPALPLNWLSIN